MAETKPQTTSDARDERKPQASATAVAETSAKPGTTASASVTSTRKAAGKDADQRTTEQEAGETPPQPSPTQAELDAMRESTLAGGQRRDLQPEGKAVDYKTR